MNPIVVIAHLEATDDTDAPFVWWAETDAVAGFSAAADTLPELIASAQAALADLLGVGTAVRFQLAPPTDTATGDVDAPFRTRSTTPASVAVLARA